MSATRRNQQLMPTDELLETIYGALEQSSCNSELDEPNNEIAYLRDAVTLLADLVDREQKIRRAGLPSSVEVVR